MKKYKIIFLGTPIFAEQVLKKILTCNFFEVVAVITQPDRIQGRKHQFIFSPVKKIALENNLLLFQPEKIIDIESELKKLSFDILLTCAFGQFLPNSILKLAKLNALNIHASLLPKLRGGAPIHKAIISGEIETGITIMQMANKMDAGGIYCQKKILINYNETYTSLHDKLVFLACEMIANDLYLVIDNKFKLFSQIESEVTFAYNITRQEEKINWSLSSKQIDQQIRGLSLVPGAWTICQNYNYKIYNSFVSKEQLLLSDISLSNGKIINISNQGIKVKCFDGYLYLTLIQKAGKKIVSANTFANCQDQTIKVGSCFE